MILKALYDYYHRSGDDVAPFGLEYKEIVRGEKRCVSKFGRSENI